MDKRRNARYARIHNQLEELLKESPNLISAMSTVCAVLHHKMRHHSWTGFYVLQGANLNVGPYQGAVACQVLAEQGVCLACVSNGEAQVVPDVEAFPGHIACDSRSKSEIVIPLKSKGRVVAVLDVDSTELASFTQADVEPLERIVSLLERFVTD